MAMTVRAKTGTKSGSRGLNGFVTANVVSGTSFLLSVPGI